MILEDELYEEIKKLDPQFEIDSRLASFTEEEIIESIKESEDHLGESYKEIETYRYLEAKAMAATAFILDK